MNRFSLFVAKLSDPRILWIVMLFTLLALALVAGAPDGGGCGSSSC